MWDWVAALADLGRGGEPLALVTVTRCTGSTPREVGAKMIVAASGRLAGTIGGGHLEELAVGDALRCLESGVSQVVSYPLGPRTGQCCGGAVDVFVEVVGSGPTLLLFGAGHVGQALCRILAPTPFRIELVDARGEWLYAKEVPESVVRHEAAWDEVTSTLPWDADRTFVVVMTHRHDLDQEIVAHVVQKDAKYIGLIGSETKWSRFRARLLARGVPEAALARVKCPLGLDIGGKSPQEVAISAAAELLKIHHGR